MVSTTNQKQTPQPRRSARLLANGAGLTRPPPSSGQVSVPEDTEHSPRRSARQLGDGDKSPSTLQFSGLRSVPEDSEQPTEKPKEMCPVCGWTGNVEIHLARKKDLAYRAEREKCNTCQCGKTAADFSSRQSFNAIGRYAVQCEVQTSLLRQMAGLEAMLRQRAAPLIALVTFYH